MTQSLDPTIFQRIPILATPPSVSTSADVAQLGADVAILSPAYETIRRVFFATTQTERDQALASLKDILFTSTGAPMDGVISHLKLLQTRLPERQAYLDSVEAAKTALQQQLASAQQQLATAAGRAPSTGSTNPDVLVTTQPVPQPGTTTTTTTTTAKPTSVGLILGAVLAVAAVGGGAAYWYEKDKKKRAGAGGARETIDDLGPGDNVRITSRGKSFVGVVVAADYRGDRKGWYIEGVTKVTGQSFRWSEGVDGGTVTLL